MDAPLDPRKSVFYQRYQRSLHAAAIAAADGSSVYGGVSCGITGKFGKVDRATRRGQIYTKSDVPVITDISQLKKHKKKDDVNAFLKKALQQNFLFKSIKDTADGVLGAVSPLQHVIDCMAPQSIAAGTNIITQGDYSDNMCFYCLQSGAATAFVDERPVVPYEPGACFGELALIYNAPRAATVRATDDCKLWTINLKTFKTIQATTAVSDVQAKCEFLKKCGFLDALSTDLITRLSGAAIEREFRDGDFIIRQGEWFADSGADGKQHSEEWDPALRTEEQEFFIIQQGNVECVQVKSSKKEVALPTLSTGQHFGEMALLTDDPRRASCIAKGPVRCLCISRKNFDLLLGPVKQVLQERMRIRILQSVPILKAQSEERLKLLSNAMTSEMYADGDYIIKQGAVGEKFYVIHNGNVKCTLFDGKVEVELVKLDPGDFFGERALIKNEPRKANVIAIGDVECLVLTKSHYNEFMSKEVLDQLAQREYRGVGDERQQALEPSNALAETTEPLTAYNFDDLRMKQTLGTGTFGRVKLVQCLKDTHTYAMKIMRKKDVVEKHQDGNILSEKNLLYLCSNSPFILKLYQTFNTPNSIYMLMEFVQGGELWSYLYSPLKAQALPRNTYKGLQLPAIKFYASNVVLAIQHMHERGIAYRDLKPENLLVDSKGYLKVIDFGFAKKIPYLREGQTCLKTYTLCGTPEYLAPEIVTSKGYDKSVDCWALGCLIFEMNYQRTPFAEQGDSNTSILRRIVESENLIRGNELFDPLADPSFVAIVKKMLCTNPALRLGNTNGGMMDMRLEAFFGSDFPWPAIADHSYSNVPMKPTVKHQLDTQHFEQYAEDEREEPYKGDQSKFHGF